MHHTKIIAQIQAIIRIHIVNYGAEKHQNCVKKSTNARSDHLKWLCNPKNVPANLSYISTNRC